MTEPQQNSNLPAPIAAAITGVPASLVPASVKALDRLIGAAVGMPVAWLEYQKAKIDSKTEAFRAIDAAITQSAVTSVGNNDEFTKRAIENLVRKNYRQQTNKEAVSIAMLQDLSDSSYNEQASKSVGDGAEALPIDEDWLNVFERYAEDASTDRMQKLWGRVLAGEIRAPGKYSMRTLRFLSEFSQADALMFSDFCNNNFGALTPRLLVAAAETDIRNLLHMEAAGLIQGASALGLKYQLGFNSEGNAFIIEQSVGIMLCGDPNDKLDLSVISLTPLGQELITLLPGRDVFSAVRRIAQAIKTKKTKSAYLIRVANDKVLGTLEALWQDDNSATI